MTDPLDTLRQEVAEAVKGADAAFHHEGLFAEPCWQIIRAELLRLTWENKELRDADIFNLDQQLVEYKQRAERAEAELAAIKARIAKPVDRSHKYVQSKEHGGCSECGYPGWEPWHRVALVKVEE